LGIDTHPYLADHRIDGAPVLPLAAAADLIAASSGRVLGWPIAIRDLELLDGVRLTGDRPVRLDIRARGRGDGALDVELAAASTPAKLAYRARVERPPGPLPELEAPSALELPPLSLDEFYAHHTFHGPRLRGIERVAGLDATHIAGTVRAACAGELGERLSS